jgi:hypothetical protein
MKALRALLTNIVDYAGLYPPAGLDMTTAVLNYASYAESLDAWMLGRFIVPAARLGELEGEFARIDTTMPLPMRLSVVLGPDVAADIDAVRSFNGTHAQTFSVDAVEAKLATSTAIDQATALTEGEFELFAEVPSDPDPRPLVAAMARAGTSAKIRTGGVTPDAFPSAGGRRSLHAAVHRRRRAPSRQPPAFTIRCAPSILTYEASSPSGVM